MNAHDPRFPTEGDLAQIVYGDGDYKIVKSGRFVRCAVSGVLIPLEALRYWNPVTQEAFASPKEALARWKELQGEG